MQFRQIPLCAYTSNSKHTKHLKRTNLLLLLVGGIGYSALSSAGAWVPEEGSGYAKLGIQSYEANQFFGDDTEFGDFSSTNISFYGEYGLGNKSALYLNFLAQDLEQTNSAGNTTDSSGLSDVEIGWRYQWQAEPFVLSTSVLAKLPYFYDKNDDLPRGNGQEDLEVRVLFGKSLYPYGYIGAELGYRYRNQAPADEYRYLLEYGFSATENLYFRTKLDGILSANNADEAGTGVNSGNLALGPEFDLGKLEYTLGWNFGKGRSNVPDRWGIELTYIDDIYGDNIIEGEAIQLGVTRVF